MEVGDMPVTYPTLTLFEGAISVLAHTFRETEKNPKENKWDLKKRVNLEKLQPVVFTILLTNVVTQLFESKLLFCFCKLFVGNYWLVKYH